MFTRTTALSCLAVAFAVTCGCTAPAASVPAPSAPEIRLSIGYRPAIEIAGLSRHDRQALEALRLTDEEWIRVFRVAVGKDGDRPPVAGRYEIADTVRFTPMYPLDAGRDYEVAFDIAKAGRAGLPVIPAAHIRLALPGVAATPETIVTAVYPSGGAIPENQLRMYVHFSAPMGQQSALDQIVFVDEAGKEIADAFLPLDTELWTADRTRLTVLLDPGRVKREILPNRAMGRPLRAGDTVTLIVKANWKDAHGAPLKAEFRHEYRVTPPIEAPINTNAWRVAAPEAGTREPLRLTFPNPLDHALLQRALQVSHGGKPVTGTVVVEQAEHAWVFEPSEPWQDGSYAVLVQPILEDLAGNRIGRAFEVRSPGDAVPAEDTRPLPIGFRPSLSR